MFVPRWLGPLAHVSELPASLPDAAERLGDSLGVTFPQVESHAPGKKSDKPSNWAAKARRRKRREAARRILDDSDTAMFLIMIILARRPVTLAWTVTMRVPRTDPGTGDSGSDAETKEYAKRKRDAARKSIQNTLVPYLTDYWGLVRTSKVGDHTNKDEIQNGGAALKKGQIVIEPTHLAHQLLNSIKDDVRRLSVNLTAAFFTKKHPVGAAISSFEKTSSAGKREKKRPAGAGKRKPK